MRTGDDGFFGWLQTVLYIATAWACFRRSRPGATQALARTISERRAWLLLAGTCLVLGVNKQLDIQIWLLDVLKTLVRQAELGEQKNLVRIVVLLAAAGFVLVVGVYAANVVRRATWGLRLAVAGLVLLGPFALLRMARFSNLPSVFGSGGALDVTLELVPTVLILSGALWKPARGLGAGRR